MHIEVEVEAANNGQVWKEIQNQIHLEPCGV